MRLRIQHALFAGYLGVVGLLVALIVLMVGSGLRRELRADFREELDRLLALGERIVSSSSGLDPHALARVITERTGYRVTLIRPDGVVIGDSFVDPTEVSAVENHADRPEVQAALGGARTAFSERESATVGTSLLYGARLAPLAGEPVVLRIAAPQTSIEATVGRIQTTVAAVGILATLLALVAAYVLSGALARPLVGLAERTRGIAQGDADTVRPQRLRIVEVDELASAFERLTEELRHRIGELGEERDAIQALIDCMAEGVVALTDDARILRTNRAAHEMLDVPKEPRLAPVGSVIRHPELREALKQPTIDPTAPREVLIGGRHVLVASRALDRGGSVATLMDITDLRRMERVRSDFVANASHELKTPLTSIRGYAEALADDPPEELQRKFLGSILSNTLRLQHLVDDLLDLSRLESGAWSAKLEDVPVRDVVEEAWELVAAVGAELEVHFEIRGDDVVLADRQGLIQVFRNLLDNAVRHTPDGGHVTVTTRPEAAGAHVVITVADDGEGIPAQALPRVFERFYRADSARARHAGGTGLGLAIVKHLVDAMDGEVWATSELARGTSVTVRLPAAGELSP